MIPPNLAGNVCFTSPCSANSAAMTVAQAVILPTYMREAELNIAHGMEIE